MGTRIFTTTDERGDARAMLREDAPSDEATPSGEAGAPGRASARIRRLVDVVLHDDGEARLVPEP
jgi:hypothetical protein